MIFSAPRTCFSGKALRVPCMVTLLYCSMSSLYTPGGKVLGILSSGSLEVVAAGAAVGPGAAGPGLERLGECFCRWLCVLPLVRL